MNRILLLFLLFLPCLSIGQEMMVSSPQKMNSKAPRFAILGKNQEGIVVRRYGKTETEIDIYDDRLNLVRNKKISFGEDYLIKSITLNPSGATAFYLHETKEASYLYGRQLNSKYEAAGKAIILDTITGYKGQVYDFLHYTSSQNRYFYLFYLEHFEDEKLKQVSIEVINRTLDTAYERTFSIPFEGQEVNDVLVSNRGDAWVITNPIPDKKDEQPLQEFTVYFFRADSNTSGSFSFRSSFPIYDKPYWTFDNRNKNLSLSAFINTPDVRGNKAAGGILYQRIDPFNGAVIASAERDFNKGFIFQLTGMDTSKMEDKVYTFKVKDVIQRLDGGALIVTESDYSDVDQDNFSTYVSPGFSNFRTVTVYYYNDVVIFSIGPDGANEWQAILRKKQVSEDDNGSFSSYAIMNTGDKIHFVYPVDIYSGADAAEYLISPTGELDRDILFNMADKDVMLVPKLAKQVSPRELVMPSYKKGSLRVVKITY
jgi:hypothetical protein